MIKSNFVYFSMLLSATNIRIKEGGDFPRNLALLMYSAHLSLRANAHTRHDKQFNKQPNDQGRGSYTKEGRPVMPRAKPEGETQAGNQPMRRGLGRRDYSRLKTAGTRTGITDPFLSIPVKPSSPLPPPPPLSPPPCHRALGGQQVDPWAREGGEGKERGGGERCHLDNSRGSVDRKTFRRVDG